MNKKITRSNASLKISNDVIIKIAEVSATEIKGVAAEGEHLCVSDKGVTGVAIANKFISPVKIDIKNDSAVVNISIVVLQGYNASEVASAVQQSVKSAIQNMTGVSVSKVNVRIADIKLNEITE